MPKYYIDITTVNPLKITGYGIPKIGDWYLNDSRREFLKLPDPGTPANTELLTLLDEADSYLK